MDDFRDSPLSETLTPEVCPSSQAICTDDSIVPKIMEQGYTEEQIVQISQLPIKERKRLMPKFWDDKGRPHREREKWETKFRQARTAGLVKQPSPAECGSFPRLLPRTPRHQAQENDSGLAARHWSWQSKTLPSGCQQCEIKERKCDLSGSRHSIGESCGPCLSKGEACSLSTIGISARPRRPDSKIVNRGIKRKQPSNHVNQDRKHSRKVPRRFARPSLVLDEQARVEIEESLPPEENAIRNDLVELNWNGVGESAISAEERDRENNTIPASDQTWTDVEESVPPENDNPERQIPPSGVLMSSLKNKRICYREYDNAVSSVHRKLQEQISKPDRDLGNGQLELVCNGTPCSREWFTPEYLEKYCGIQPQDIEESKQRNGFWYCPECAGRKQIRHAIESTSDIPTRFGRYALTDKEIGDDLHEFSGWILQYIDTAQTHTSALQLQTPFLQIPCIRDETEPANQLIHVLRRMLNMLPGVLVKDQVTNLRLQDLDTATWTSSILSFILGEFIFKFPSAFDDLSSMRKCLAYSFSSDIADLLIQDSRIRTMREEPTPFTDRIQTSQAQYIRQLNAAMAPLAGSNDRIHGFHCQIAKLASDLNTKFAAYTGTFEEISPNPGDEFDPRFHALDDPEQESMICAGTKIQIRTIIGVKFRLPGVERTCSRAKVQLWHAPDRPPPQEHALADRDLPQEHALVDRPPLQDHTLVDNGYSGKDNDRGTEHKDIGKANIFANGYHQDHGCVNHNSCGDDNGSGTARKRQIDLTSER